MENREYIKVEMEKVLRLHSGQGFDHEKVIQDQTRALSEWFTNMYNNVEELEHAFKLLCYLNKTKDSTIVKIDTEKINQIGNSKVLDFRLAEEGFTHMYHKVNHEK